MNELHIMLVEDNEGDIVLTTEAFKNAGITGAISVLRDGQEAMDFLYRRNKFIKAATPDIILLDINLPKINGKEVLIAIKNDEELKTIPVIMLSSSAAENDILESYSNYANCFITKPMHFKDFRLVIQEIKKFWFSVATITLNRPFYA